MDYNKEFNLQKKKLSSYILWDRLSFFSFTLAIILNFLIFPIMIYLEKRGLKDLVLQYKIYSYVFMAFFIGLTIFSQFSRFKSKSLGYRTKIFLLLYNLANSNNLKELKKYNKLLYKESSYLEKDEIKDKDVIFESNEMNSNKLKENLNVLAKKINYLLINNKLNKLNRKSLKQFANSIYSRQSSIVEESSKIMKGYTSILEFPTNWDTFKKICSHKVSRFILIELAIVILLILIGIYLYKEMGVLLVGFFTLTAANISINFK